MFKNLETYPIAMFEIHDSIYEAHFEQQFLKSIILYQPHEENQNDQLRNAASHHM